MLSAYKGLLQILTYNRPFYIRACIGATAALVTALYLPPLFRVPLLAAAGAGAFWMCSSLAVSHYVYDKSPLYSLSWLPACLSQPPARWLNLHNGLDEINSTLPSLFPNAQGQLLDIFDPAEMREPSINRDRQLAQIIADPVDWRALPLPEGTFDAAFILFTAHELRRHQARAQLFSEIKRVLRAGGELVLVEHLCDLPNFLAFGPGFLHFFSKRTWLKAATAAGLCLRLQRTVTPFVHVFVLGKPQ